MHIQRWPHVQPIILCLARYLTSPDAINKLKTTSLQLQYSLSFHETFHRSPSHGVVTANRIAFPLYSSLNGSCYLNLDSDPQGERQCCCEGSKTSRCSTTTWWIFFLWPFLLDIHRRTSSIKASGNYQSSPRGMQVDLLWLAGICQYTEKEKTLLLVCSPRTMQ